MSAHPCNVMLPPLPAPRRCHPRPGSISRPRRPMDQPAHQWSTPLYAVFPLVSLPIADISFCKRPSTTPCFRRRFLGPLQLSFSTSSLVCLLYIVLHLMLMCIYSAAGTAPGWSNVTDPTLVMGNVQSLVQGSGRHYLFYCPAVNIGD